MTLAEVRNYDLKVFMKLCLALSNSTFEVNQDVVALYIVVSYVPLMYCFEGS